MMKAQSYFNSIDERSANVCDMSRSIIVNCVGVADDRVSFHNRSVRNDYYIMYHIGAGFDIRIKDETFFIEKGDVLIIEPGTEYEYYLCKDSGLNYLWLHFTGSNAKNLLDKFSIEVNKIHKCGQISYMIDNWRKMFGEFVNNDEYFYSVTEALLTDIIATFSRHIKTGGNKKLFKSLFYIHENFRSKITLEKLSELESISQSHYRALFKSMYNQSPTEYILDIRLREAKKLLEETEETLSDIALKTGFFDEFYMSKQFKNHFGITPGRYRKECK